MVHVEVLRCLLALQIRSINLDDEKEKELKQKKMEAHKARLINMSKKERKRMKKLKELEKELQETKAEENKQTKHYKLTEITKMVFTIYFRILKNDPSSQLLSACLEGLAEWVAQLNRFFTKTKQNPIRFFCLEFQICSHHQFGLFLWFGRSIESNYGNGWAGLSRAAALHPNGVHNFIGPRWSAEYRSVTILWAFIS